MNGRMFAPSGPSLHFQSRHSPDEQGGQTLVSRNGAALALLRPVPVESRPGRELQLLLQTQDLRVVHAL